MSLSTDSSTGHFWTSSKSLSGAAEEILTTDVLTFTFANLSRYDNDKPVSCLNLETLRSRNGANKDLIQIFIDAKNPSHFVSASQASEIVARLVKGFERIGIKEGDCVCLHAYNNVRFLCCSKRLFPPPFCFTICRVTVLTGSIWGYDRSGIP